MTEYARASPSDHPLHLGLHLLLVTILLSLSPGYFSQKNQTIKSWAMALAHLPTRLAAYLPCNRETCSLSQITYNLGDIVLFPPQQNSLGSCSSLHGTCRRAWTPESQMNGRTKGTDTCWMNGWENELICKCILKQCSISWFSSAHLLAPSLNISHKHPGLFSHWDLCYGFVSPPVQAGLEIPSQMPTQAASPVRAHGPKVRLCEYKHSKLSSPHIFSRPQGKPVYHKTFMSWRLSLFSSGYHCICIKGGNIFFFWNIWYCVIVDVFFPLFYRMTLFCFILNYVGVCACECRYPQRPKVAQIPGNSYRNFEPSGMDTGNEAQILWRNKKHP